MPLGKFIMILACVIAAAGATIWSATLIVPAAPAAPLAIALIGCAALRLTVWRAGKRH
ncbi:hypothetical protein [Roseovarius spongiae]|uniref:hypothetical protein n=1 Tax=Roseovarius spongiae TaxID=2320272 RepID=UPI00140A68A2|nr:hypothetical protein [Roseovarius spongiae]